jgi:HPt (histidine-containing phosphotransfer) domain-containing protein
MNSLPLEVWEQLWGGLRAGPHDQEKAWFVEQGNWACEFARRDGGPQLFDLEVWAQDLGRIHGLRVQIQEGLPRLRWGHPQALEYLLLAVCWRAFGLSVPTLKLGGDDCELTFQAPGRIAEEQVAGPFVAYLLGLVAGRLCEQELLRCPCLAQQQEMVGTPVDVEALNRSCMDDAEFERELIETFTAEGHRQLAGLALNYNSHTLHSLKGSAGMVGALRLAEMLGEQEKALQKEQLPELEAEFNRVVAFLQSRL